MLISYQGELTTSGGALVTGAKSMTFKLYHQASGGTAVWTETQNVTVSNGLFHVLLGSVTALNSSILTGDLYLGVKVGTDNEMTPRERLGSVPYAVEASTVPDGSITVAKLNLVSGNVGIGTSSPSEKLHVHNGSIRISDANGGWELWGGSNLHFRDDGVDRVFLGGNGNVGIGTISPGAKLDVDGVLNVRGNLAVNGADLALTGRNSGGTGNPGRALVDGGSDWGLVVNWGNDFGKISMGSDINMNGSSISNVGNIYGAGGSQIHMPPGHGGDMFINWHQGGRLVYGGGQKTTKFAVDTNGSVTCGGLVEANLQTPDERDGKSPSRFELGDVLVWRDGQLEKCDKASDPLVQAVADQDGKPIVMGAEPIKVIGPVQEGDYLVTSDAPGYAMAAKNPTFGVVIAQALENFDGEQGIIKAMIRKM